MSTLQQLLTAATTGNSNEVGWNGGKGTAIVSISGSVTVTLQMSPDSGTTWVSMGTTAELTATGAFAFSLAPGFKIRFSITGTATSVDAWIAGPHR